MINCTIWIITSAFYIWILRSLSFIPDKTNKNFPQGRQIRFYSNLTVSVDL